MAKNRKRNYNRRSRKRSKSSNIIYVDNADEIIEEGDYSEIKIINSRTAVILDKINTLVANAQELKIDRGETARNVRQWKKEIKESYTKLVEQMGKLTEAYNRKQRGHLSAHASEGQCVEYANREILAELKIESVNIMVIRRHPLPYKIRRQAR